MAILTPLFEADPAGGQIVVTRFECGSLPKLLAVRFLHVALAREVRRHARGFLGIKVITSLRHRTILSISLWDHIDSVYTIGEVRRHTRAVRLTHRLDVRTSCGIFCFAGGCQRVLFRFNAEVRSPLHPLADPPLQPVMQRKETTHGPSDNSRIRGDGYQDGRDDHGHDVRIGN